MSPISSDTIMIRFSFRTTRPSDTVPIIGSGFHQAPRRVTPNVDNPYAQLMALPVVAIVGRPNVGKSALFNRILGERRAIVDPMAGLTRDRLYAESEWQGGKLVIIPKAGGGWGGGVDGGGHARGARAGEGGAGAAPPRAGGTVG